MIEILGRPISKKRSYRRSRNGGFYLSDTYKNWQEQALWQLKNYKERHTGPIKIYYQFEMKGKLDTDLDNMVVSIDDLLEDAGIIDNDKNIVASETAKYHGFKKWRTILRIEELSDDSTDQNSH